MATIIKVHTPEGYPAEVQVKKSEIRKVAKMLCEKGYIIRGVRKA